MKTLADIKNTLMIHKKDLSQKYFLKDIGIFGSYVKNTQTATSDLDVLVDFEEIPTLFDLVGLRDELSDLLDTKVDLVMKSTLKPRISKRILEEVIPL
jgi:predicted nucleotidyltransferase